MRSLPSGTVTFLFTDVEGSTRLLHELGADGYAAALDEHRRLLRAAFTRHGGVEVDTQGDAFFVAFPTAPGALAAACDAQAGLAFGRIRVRMGVHTGTPHLAAEGYVGVDVHRAARIAAAGHGGQVLVSASTASLVGDALRDLGEHRLKDLSAPERLYQLGDGDFPPLKTLHHTNLPVPSTPFLGREWELAQVVTLLARDDLSLLTLTGPGGTGKTRLALQAVAASVESFPDGVYWVPLAALRDAALVLETAGRALGAADGDLPAHVGSKRLLLLLDNFEHVVEAATGVAELLAACPQLVVLVTSREPLRITAEQEYPVPPYAHEEAVGFFLARARAVEPAFAPDPALSEICRRLDDLPLALELAAARVKVLSAEQLLERLEERLPLLTSGARDLPERQRTLRATIAWSHDLLSDEERRVFAGLSVFVGGCTLEAAEAVVGADLDVLHSLLEKSLVRRTENRYWMLETIGEYASERLVESGEANELRRRHATFYLALAESANLTVESIWAGGRYDLVIPEADNVRAVLDWSLEAGDAELGASIAVALEQYWVSVNPHEGIRRFGELLERDLPAPLRARALRVRGGVSYIVGDFDEGTRWHERALTEFRRLGDAAAAGHMLHRLAIEANRAGDQRKAEALCEESLTLDRNARSLAFALDLRADIAFAEGRGDEALDLFRESARLFGEAGFHWAESNALLHHAECALKLGKPDDASSSARQALAIARSIGDRQWVFYSLTLIAWAGAEEGRAEEAGRLWGALEADAERGPVGQWENERDTYAERVLSVAGADFERARKQGRRLSLDEAVDEALHAID